ncbi:phosphorylase family protein [Acaryochloris marina NIES-2412]|uniref:5'-methylthioadenosine/S-adenosylhomocysteine nucleosidase family protein n=1 Tax=Acaryochloris marina TaxID=155978 RepID=UPI004058EEDE
MGVNFQQSIAKNRQLKQSGKLPSAMDQAEKPKLALTDCYENMPVGKAVILTALPVEHKAVEAHLLPFDSSTCLLENIHPETKTIYTRGQFKTNACIWDVNIAQINMGNENAALETGRAISYLKPDVILFVGVAGGIKDVRIGDVVAASVVYNYESGKAVANHTLPRSKARDADYDLHQRACAESRKELWQQRILAEIGTSEKIPKSYVKPIAAGEKVIASRKAKIYKYLQKYYSDAIAVEMEGAGFLKATQQVKSVSAMVIRGISDLIDGKNDDSEESEEVRQERASCHASAFAFEVLANFYGQATANHIVENVKPFEIEIDRTLLANQPHVYIEALEGDEYHLRAFHSNNEPLIIDGVFETMLAQITRLIHSGQEPEIILDEIDECNERLKENENCPIGKFLKWLSAQNLTDESSCLSIDNRTELGIPWELLEVDNLPLGAVLQTIRQKHSILDYTSFSNQYCKGKLLAYTIRNNYKWQTIYDWHGHSKFSDFLSNLQRSKTDYGMIFIDAFSVKEPICDRPRAYIKRSSLVKKGASVFFVNGQMNFDKSIQLKHSTFLHLFLRYGARGVIGTIGEIESDISEQVVEKIFELLRESTQKYSVSMPSILKQMRKQVYEALNSKTENNIALYIATFLYIYYGDNKIFLQLMHNCSSV